MDTLAIASVAPMEWSRSEGVSLAALSGTENVAFGVAERLQSGSDAWERFLDRDRLNPAAMQAAMGGAAAGWWR